MVDAHHSKFLPIIYHIMQQKQSFQLSHCVANYTKDWKQSAYYYKDIMGLNVLELESHLEIKNEKLFNVCSG